MILLDTNVNSELMRAKPAQIVLDWFGQHDAGDMFISAITEAELRTGVAILPDGQRRDRLQLAIDAMIDQDFQGRVLPFDCLAAKAYAEIAASAAPRADPLPRPTARSLRSLVPVVLLSRPETSRTLRYLASVS